MTMRACNRGFTLIEVAIGMTILALSAAGLVMVLSAQGEQRRWTETRAALAGAREALLAFATAHGRLPCPATPASGGREADAPPGSGACVQAAGRLPAVTLGLSGVDAGGWLVDGWNRPLRYGITPLAGAVANATTRPGLGNPAVNRPLVTDAFAIQDQGLFVCRSAAGLVAAGNRCGSDANTLSRNAAATLWSDGANGGEPAAWSNDERQNAGVAAPTVPRVIVSRDAMPAGATGGAFDDIATWIPYPLFIDRLLTAGHVQ
jgi:prepilin-type N-terminal cleavage/methylation domain-containing protein